MSRLWNLVALLATLAVIPACKSNHQQPVGDDVGDDSGVDSDSLADNTTPRLYSQPEGDAFEGRTWRYPALAEDLDADTVDWSLVSGPDGMTINPWGLVEWTPGIGQTGPHDAVLSVSDGVHPAVEQSFTVNVQEGAQPPRIVSLPTLRAQAGTTWTYQAQAEDPDDLPSQLTWSVTPGEVAVSGDGKLTWSVTQAHRGNNPMVLTVTDPTGRSDTQAFSVGVAVPGDTRGPNVSVSVPTEITGHTDLMGTVGDEALAGYTVDLCDADGDCRELGVGLAPTTDEVVRVNPHMIPDGDYTLVVEAEDAGGNTTTVERDVTIGGEKFGALKIAFDDLTVRRKGGSWTLTRVYDGFDAEDDGSLGYGWRYGIEKKDEGGTASITVHEPFAEGWIVYFHYTGFYIQSEYYHPITLNTSDGRFYQFSIEIEHYPSSLDSLHPNGPRLYQDFGPTVRKFELLDRSRKAYSTTGYPFYGLQTGSSGSGNALEIYDDLSFSSPWQPAYVHVVTDLNEDLLFDAETGELLEGEVVGGVSDADGVIVDVEAGDVTYEGEVLITLDKDAEGKITSAVDEVTGATVTYERDVNGDLVAATDVDGKNQAFFYADGHRMTGFEIDGRQPEEWWYDADGRLLLYKGRGGEITENTYFDDEKRVETRDAAGNLTEAFYDDHGRTRKVIDPLGNETTMAYDADGNVTRFVDALGSVKTYGYDSEGRRTSTVDEEGARTSYGYAPGEDEVTSMVDGEGRAYREILSDGSPTEYRLPDGSAALRVSYGSDTITYRDDLRTWSVTYDDFGNVTRTTEGADVVDLSYTPDGRVATTTDFSGTTTTERDYSDRIISVDYIGGTLTYDYDGDSLERAVDPTGREHEWITDDAGRLTSVVDDGEVVQRRSYDAYGRVASEWSAEEGATVYKYDAAGRVSEVTKRGVVTTYTRDGNGRVSRMETDTGYWVAYTRDGVGRVTEERNATGKIENWAYDGSGRITEYHDGVGRTHELEYDANGMLATARDPGGASTSWTYYNTQDMLTGDPVIESMTLPEGVTFHFDYADGELTRIRDQLGNTTAFAEDNNNLAITDAEGRSWSFAYRVDGMDLTWPGGDVESWTWDGETTDWDRVDGSLVSTALDGESIDIEVDGTAFGALDASVPDVTREGIDATGQWHQREVGASRKVERVSTDDGAVVDLTYGPDALLEELDLTLPDGTHTIQYDYDVEGRLTEIIDPDGGSTTFAWDGADRVTQVTRPNGVTTIYTWSVYARPDRIAHRKGGTLIDAVDYSFDARGRIVGESWDSGLERVYSYDALGRLEDVEVYRGGSRVDDQATTWDAVGNRAAISTDAGTTTFTVDDDDRLVSATGASDVTWTFTDRGALASRTEGAASTDYSYDDLDRLERVDLPDGTWVAYTYDVTGRMLSRTHVDDGELRFLPLPENLRGLADIAAMYKTDGSGTTVVVHGPVGPSSMHGADEGWFLHDARGSVSGITDGTGAAGASFEYAAFGARTATGDAASYGWLGEFQDPDTGLVYLRKRWYDPETARFLTPDRYDADATDPRTLHRYAYSLGDPLNRDDRTGEFSLIGMISGMNISTIMRNIQSVAVQCAKKVVINKLRAAAGQFLLGLIADPVKQVVLQGLGIGNLAWAKNLTETDLDDYLNKVLCSKKTAATGKDVQILSVEFQVKLDGDHCGGRDPSAKACGSTVAVGENGIDIVMGGFIPVELKKSKISGGQGKGQLKRFCRFAAQESNVMFYVFLRFPTLAQLNNYAKACWGCWNRNWPGSKTKIKNKYLKTCKGKTSDTGAIFVGFAMFKQKKGQKGYDKRYYIPDPRNTIPCI